MAETRPANAHAIQSLLRSTAPYQNPGLTFIRTWFKMSALKVACMGTPCQASTRSTNAKITVKPAAAASDWRTESAPALARHGALARTPAMEAVTTTQYACDAGSFRCIRINVKGNTRADAPAAYFAVRQYQAGGD